MPYKILSNPDGTKRLINAQTGRVVAKRTTLQRAKRQLRLLQGVEHGWTPTNASAS